MDALRRKYGNWSLVAGGAMGLGAAFCENLAQRGFNIILIDVNEEKMQSLSIRLKRDYNVEVLCSKLELSESGVELSMQDLINEKKCRLIIYNAAYGPVKRFISNTSEELDYYLNVNSRTLLKLVHTYAQSHNCKSKAGILIMSSLAGFWGTQLVAPYSATKAFDLNLGEALHHELKDQNIDISVCSAGATDTPNYRSTNPKYGFLKPNILPPDNVAAYALKVLGKGPVFIPGFYNKVTYFILNHLLSRRLAIKLMNNTMGKMYRET